MKQGTKDVAEILMVSIILNTENKKNKKPNIFIVKSFVPCFIVSS